MQNTEPFIDLSKFASMVEAVGISGPTKILDILGLQRLVYGLSSESGKHRFHTANAEKDANEIITYIKSLGFHTRSFKESFNPNGADSHLCFLKDNNVTNQNVIEAAVLIRPYGDMVSVRWVSSPTFSQKLKTRIEIEYPDSGSIILTVTGIIESSGYVKKENTFIDTKSVSLARQCFYPNLSVSLEEYYKAFLESDESVLVLFGPPGMGKSTLLRALIAYSEKDAYLVYDHNLIPRTEIIRDFYSNRSAGILAYEDVDKFLGKREDGNDLMSTLLNETNGVVKRTGKKIVLSTNLSSIDRIDPALLRCGRCFDIMQFNQYTVEEARVILDEMKMDGSDSIDLSSKDKWSLAELMHPPVKAQQSTNRFGKRTGFF